MYKFLLPILALGFSVSVSAASFATDSIAEQQLVETYGIKSIEANKKGSPYALIQNIGEQVFASVAAVKAQNTDVSEDELMTLIVERQLMPYIDVKFASYKILGSQLKKSKREERDLFVEAMQKNMVTTYSSALAQYNNQTINYEPAKDVSDKRTVAIKTELVAPGQPTVDMTFKLRKNKKTGEWKAYDLVVEGISLVDAKRAELSKPLRQNGIKYVAENLLN